MTTLVHFGVHLKQKQQNAEHLDMVFNAESRSHALFMIANLADDHGYFVGPEIYRIDDLPSQVDLGSSLVYLLRSDEWDPVEEACNYEPDRHGELEFRLQKPNATNIEERKVILVRYVCGLPDVQ